MNRKEKEKLVKKTAYTILLNQVIDRQVAEIERTISNEERQKLADFIEDLIDNKLSKEFGFSQAKLIWFTERLNFASRAIISKKLLEEMMQYDKVQGVKK